MSDEKNYGQVYIFNCCMEPVRTLSVNGYNVGDKIAGWPKDGDDGKYTPQSVAVDRAKHWDDIEEAAFVNDRKNEVTIRWDSKVRTTEIKLPDTVEYSLDSDLILYVGIDLDDPLLLDSAGRQHTSPKK